MDIQKLAVGICDDEPKDLERIKCAVIEAIQNLQPKIKPDINLFTSGKSLFDFNSEKAFDLVFIDLEMPEWSGMKLAQQLNKSTPTPKIIFVSHHESRVFDTYEYMPLWFVRKSVLKKDTDKAMLKYFQITGAERISYSFKDGFSYREILLNEILYIECTGHHFFVKLTSGKEYRFYGSLKLIEQNLPPHHFLRVHRSFLVNREYIVEVRKEDVVLTNHIEIPMGKDRRKKLKGEIGLYDKRKH